MDPLVFNLKKYSHTGSGRHRPRPHALARLSAQVNRGSALRINRTIRERSLREIADGAFQRTNIHLSRAEKKGRNGLPLPVRQLRAPWRKCFSCGRHASLSSAREIHC